MENITQKMRISILLFVILILVADWFQYFLYMLINFFNYRSEIPMIDLLLIVSIFISPLICSIAVKYSNKPKIPNFIVYVSIVVLALLMYIYYLSYIQIGILLDQNPGLNTISPIIGFVTGDGNLTKRLMFIVNATAFVLIIPILISKIESESQEIYQSTNQTIGIETIIAFILCSAYMGFRGGSMLSAPFRISLALIIALGALLLVEIFGKYMRNEEKVSGSEDQRIILTIPIMIILSFIIGVLTLGDFGVLYQSNTWFIGIIASAIVIRALTAKIDISKTWMILIKILWISLLTLYCFAGMIGSLIPFLSIIKMGLVLSAALMLSIINVETKDESDKSNPKRSNLIYILVRSYLGLIFFVFGLLLYFSQPFTNLAVFILMLLPSLYLNKSKSIK